MSKGSVSKTQSKNDEKLILEISKIFWLKMSKKFKIRLKKAYDKIVEKHILKMSKSLGWNCLECKILRINFRRMLSSRMLRKKQLISLVWKFQKSQTAKA